MGLRFHPKQGTIILARFDAGFKKPEMVKNRLSIVVSKEMKGRMGLCTIVPLSLPPPRPKQAHLGDVAALFSSAFKTLNRAIGPFGDTKPWPNVVRPLLQSLDEVKL